MKVTFKGVTDKNTTIDIQNLVSFTYKADLIYIADEINAVFIPPKTRSTIIKLYGYLDGVLFFDGIVDCQSEVLNEKGRYLNIIGSRHTALLCQNQVQPRTVFNYNSNMLFDDYAKPYGIKAHDLPAVTSVDVLNVGPGMTAWDVIDAFCRQTYNTPPRIDRYGVLTINRLSGNVLKLSNTKAGYINYSQISICDNRKNMISRVFVKRNDIPDDNDYSIIVDSPYTTPLQIMRERYYKPTAAWTNLREQGGREIIRNSSRKSLMLEITVPRLLDTYVGDSVDIEDSFIKDKRYYVGAFKVSMDKDGYKTKLSLWNTIRS